MTAKLAECLGVKKLILTHVSSRYKPITALLKEGEKSAQILLDEALEVLSPDQVILAEDFLVYPIPKRK
ncbi:Zinc phosphodiesterase elac protein 1 [Plakobranchus ocellatus]|uniref:Zinc phosphodiesterase elac protein 1 n=1 Tax=Plakobranchus ocellatus TaxID=259542 RepID=A0AAV4BQ06_9GAST|nr:Zinc phosphodiesterase elac protein 1 [Plakobranchus ocellatus]